MRAGQSYLCVYVCEWQEFSDAVVCGGTAKATSVWVGLSVCMTVLCVCGRNVLMQLVMEGGNSNNRSGVGVFCVDDSCLRVQ